MPLFARRPRSLDDTLIARADSLDRHAAEIRQLAGLPIGEPKPDPNAWEHTTFIDPAIIAADDEASEKTGCH